MSVLTNTFSAIANAIRNQLGVNTTYKPSQMANAINSMRTSSYTLYGVSLSGEENMRRTFIIMTDLQYQTLSSITSRTRVQSAGLFELNIEAVGASNDIEVTLYTQEGLASHRYRKSGYKVYFEPSSIDMELSYFKNGR